MLATIRQLNGFGNILQSHNIHIPLQVKIREIVQQMLQDGIIKYNLPEETAEQKQICKLVRIADRVLICQTSTDPKHDYEQRMLEEILGSVF